MKGCAMDTVCATAYANIFMAEFEQIQLNKTQFFSYAILRSLWYGKTEKRI